MTPELSTRLSVEVRPRNGFQPSMSLSPAVLGASISTILACACASPVLHMLANRAVTMVVRMEVSGHLVGAAGAGAAAGAAGAFPFAAGAFSPSTDVDIAAWGR